jgi:uncharacterized protein (DUF1778 family)
MSTTDATPPTKTVTVYMPTLEERRLIQRAAKKLGKDRSGFIREAALAAAARVLKVKSKKAA